MPDFSKLASRESGKAKRAPPLPVSSADPYYGIVSSWEFFEAPTNRVVDYEMGIRFQIRLTDWPDNGIAEEDKQEEVDDGVFQPIDLTKKQLRRDFYDNSLVRLDEFLRSCGVELGAPYVEVCPQVIGKQVRVEVQQYQNRATGEMGNQVGTLAGVDG